MNTDKLQQLWKCYLDAYSDIPADERERLLKQSVSDDVIFTGPREDDQGFDKLVEHIGQFQKKSPGAYFESNKLLMGKPSSFYNTYVTASDSFRRQGKGWVFTKRVFDYIWLDTKPFSGDAFKLPVLKTLSTR
jgi:hypothetical protein